MRAIIKKIGAVVGSRVFYLILGVFLAAGFVAYAAWDGARTGGSGELSESNWNELVSMIEANVGGGPVWRGYTTATYDGNMGGVKGVNEKCDAEYSNSHACAYDEIIKLGNNYPWSKNAWVIDGALPVMTENNAARSVTKDGYMMVQSPQSMCSGWTSNSVVYQQKGPYASVGGFINVAPCNVAYSISCCGD